MIPLAIHQSVLGCLTGSQLYVVAFNNEVTQRDTRDVGEWRPCSIITKGGPHPLCHVVHNDSNFVNDIINNDSIYIVVVITVDTPLSIISIFFTPFNLLFHRQFILQFICFLIIILKNNYINM